MRSHMCGGLIGANKIIKMAKIIIFEHFNISGSVVIYHGPSRYHPRTPHLHSWLIRLKSSFCDWSWDSWSITWSMIDHASARKSYTHTLSDKMAITFFTKLWIINRLRSWKVDSKKFLIRYGSSSNSLRIGVSGFGKLP